MAPLPHPPLAVIGPVWGFLSTLITILLFSCVLVLFLSNLPKVCLETSPLYFNVEKILKKGIIIFFWLSALNLLFKGVA